MPKSLKVYIISLALLNATSLGINGTAYLLPEPINTFLSSVKLTPASSELAR